MLIPPLAESQFIQMQCLADQVRFRHRSPIAAVITIITVIAHYKILPIRDNVFPFHAGCVRYHKDMVLYITQLLDALAGARHGYPGSLADKDTGWHLSDRFSIDMQQLVVIADTVTGKSDKPFDVVYRRVLGVSEYHDIAPLRLSDINYLDIENRQPDTIVILVHKNEVADQQCWHHGTRRDSERLHQKRAQQQHGQDYREKRLAVFDPGWLLQRPDNLPGIGRGTGIDHFGRLAAPARRP